VVEDAKAHFAAGRRRYDLIISEPSNPWVSGVSGLFTREFYRRVRNHLTTGGILGQWLHLYEINDDLVLAVLAALDESFPSYEVYLTGRMDLLIIASAGPRVPTPDWSVVRLPGARDDLRGVVPVGPDALRALHVASADVFRPLLATIARPNSDYDPVLDMGAERARFSRINADGLRALGTGYFDVASALAGYRIGFGTIPVAALPEIKRIAMLARAARLRARLDGRGLPGDAEPPDEELDRTARRLEQFEAQCATATPPTNWIFWLTEALALEEELHAGTAGVVDERFFDQARGYARRLGAPERVRRALDFQHGLASWNWAEALAAGQWLAELRRKQPLRLRTEVLRDGVAVAALRLGDRARARHYIDLLTPLVETPDAGFQLRTRLLRAHAAGPRD
jgi:spermidine synthase